MSILFKRLSGDWLEHSNLLEEVETVDGDNFKIGFEIFISNVMEKYYETCSQLDRHNRGWKESPSLKKKDEVRNWSLRVFSTLLYVNVVYS